jgi:hypothetical protein
MVQAAKEVISEFGCHRMVRETRASLQVSGGLAAAWQIASANSVSPWGWVPLLEGAAEPHKPFPGGVGGPLLGTCGLDLNNGCV